MNDNNCTHQDEQGNFCGQCGVALKEKCPECGEMEKVCRIVCEKKLAEIYALHSEFIFQKGELGGKENRQNAEQEFPWLYPEYAEILKQAEESDEKEGRENES
ncbi:MAG: hypothetical protein ACD_15C00170G0003 [uncultured bacterium]|nr:MAG: hypothetical protein ACD_15C00170G0003 [uncultured bacterium]